MSDRFDRFLPLAGVLAGLLFFAGLILLWDDPPSETAVAETFSYWQDNRGQHQIIALLARALDGAHAHLLRRRAATPARARQRRLRPRLGRLRRRPPRRRDSRSSGCSKAQ